MSETPETFTNRHYEIAIFDRIDDGRFVHQVSGGSFVLHDEAVGQVQLGTPYLLEELGGTGLGARVTGLAEFEFVTYHLQQYDTGTLIPVATKWFWHNSDQKLEADRVKMLEENERQRRESLERNQEQWQAREDALPEALKARLSHFHEKGGEKFKLDGWSYELVVCELAVLYQASGGEDDDAVMEMADREGTSGNQHMFAKALARSLDANPEYSLAGTVSALSPITGDADYSKGS